jgi:hypothetical protein
MKAVAVEESHPHDVGGREMGRIRVSDFMGGSGKIQPGPQIYLVEMLDNESRIDPHFHDTDQFQVIVQGDGVIGMNKVKRFDFHYADAFAGYGPIIAHEHGLAYQTVRINCGSGFWQVPQNKSRRGRNFMTSFDVVNIPSEGKVERDVLRSRYGDGLAAFGLRLGPNARGQGEVSDGGGQIVLVFTGFLQHAGKLLQPNSVIWVEAGEEPAKFQAGPEGAALLIMQFPKPTDREGSRGADLTKITKYQLPEGTTHT